MKFSIGILIAVFICFIVSCYEPCEENPINSERFSCPVSDVFAINITNAGLYPDIDERDTVESTTYGIRLKLIPNELLCTKISLPFINSAFAYSPQNDCLLPDNRRGPIFRYSIKNMFAVGPDTAMAEQKFYFIRRVDKDYETISTNRMTTNEQYDLILNREFSESHNQQFVVRVDLTDTSYYDTTKLVYLKK